MAPESPTFASELQAMLDASPDAVLIVDRDGTIVALNGRTETLFATPAEQLKGKPVESLLPPRLREIHAAARAEYGKAPTVRPMSAREGLMGLRGDGTEFPVEVSLTPVVGSPEGLVMAVAHEVAAPTRIEQVLERSDRSAGALDAIADPILTTDATGHIDFLNRSAERLTGWSRERARGRPLGDVLPMPAHAAEAVLPARPGRESRTLDISTTPIRDQRGELTGTAVVARDVTDARRIAQRLAHQATHDPLTGLLNRGEFERRLERALASTTQEHAEHALCFVDLDGFKRVNDTCGHAAGDELLRQLSDLMRDRMRSRDTLARLGGDEFGMILEHCRLPRARRIAAAIRNAIRAHRFTCAGETYGVGASIGIVPIRAGETRAGEVLRAADRACYSAKRGGGNRIRVGDAPDRPIGMSQDREWVRRVLEAVEHDRFQLYAQPQLPLERGGGRPARFELLLRLVLDDGQVLWPGVFLPATRRNGLMPTVDRWVVRHAVRRLADWRRAHPGADSPVMAINLADDTVAEGEMAGLVRRELADSEVPPGALCFEIGEAVAAARAAASGRLIRELRAAGCQVTLEHCGAGTAAFTLLRRLRIDSLKIAGDVVRGLPDDPVDHALATALNDVGHALGVATIGAGVETPESLACLRRLGVDFVQGHTVGRPTPLHGAMEATAPGSRLSRATRPAPSSARNHPPRPS